MNTIPTTFNEHKIPYTILEKNIHKSKKQISIIVLNRGATYYLPLFFQNLISAGFDSIIFVENSKSNINAEALSVQFPQVKFLFPLQKITTGDMINLGISETNSDYVLTIWNDMNLSTNISYEKLLNTIEKEKSSFFAPYLINTNNITIPVQIVPALNNDKTDNNKTDFYTAQFLCKTDLTKTLYMYDFAGIYNRKKFIELGGFDYTITNPYWQNLDLGFRMYLSNSKILILTSFKIKYATDIAAEDVSADDSYVKFYLKNLAPILDKKGLRLPYTIFLPYLKKSGVNFLTAYRQFKTARQWVKINKNNFQKSPYKLISEWEPVL